MEALLSIRVASGQIGLNIYPAYSPRLKSQKTRQADAKIQIDNSDPWLELKGGRPLENARQRSQANIREADAGIVRRAREGDRMLRQPNVIPLIAKENNLAPDKVRTNVGLLPRSRPHITFGDDSLEKTALLPQKPAFRSTWPALEVYMRQQAAVEIEYISPREIWA